MSDKGPKIDVLDFLIAVLKEHEKTLDGIIERFEKILKKAEGNADHR